MCGRRRPRLRLKVLDHHRQRSIQDALDFLSFLFIGMVYFYPFLYGTFPFLGEKATVALHSHYPRLPQRDSSSTPLAEHA